MHEKEALFYEKLKSNKVRCNLCALRCVIPEGKMGVCRVRENRNGTLYSLTFGMLTSYGCDPIEKKPLFHFLPASYSFSVATAGCNLKCPWCQNHDLSQSPAKGIPPSRYAVWSPPERVVKMALKNNCQSVSYTYSEPTIFYEYAKEIGIKARAQGLKNVFVTNGMMDLEVIEDALAFLDGANIDLKGGSKTIYKKHCKGKLDAVLRSIEKMHSHGIWVEVTTLIIPGLNDSDEELNFIAEFISSISTDIPWHISKFHPDYQFLSTPPTPLSTLLRAKEIGMKNGLKYIYVGNVFAEGLEDTTCPSCGFTVIKRIGFSAQTDGLKNGKCAKCGHSISGIY